MTSQYTFFYFCGQTKATFYALPNTCVSHDLYSDLKERYVKPRIMYNFSFFFRKKRQNADKEPFVKQIRMHKKSPKS